MPFDFGKEVDHVARLARLSLEEDEKERMAGQLSDILKTARRIQELDTTGIEPTSHVTERPAVLREDRVRPSLPLDKALRNAPRREKGFVKVPRITVSEQDQK